MRSALISVVLMRSSHQIHFPSLSNCSLEINQTNFSLTSFGSALRKEFSFANGHGRGLEEEAAALTRSRGLRTHLAVVLASPLGALQQSLVLPQKQLARQSVALGGRRAAVLVLGVVPLAAPLGALLLVAHLAGRLVRVAPLPRLGQLPRPFNA